MTHNYTVKGFNATEEEIKIIRDCKFNFIDRLNFSGTYYRSIRPVSGMLNDLFLLFNTDNETTFDISEIEIGSFCFVKIREHSKLFYKEMETKKLNPELISLIESIVEDYLENLEVTTNKIQEERTSIK